MAIALPQFAAFDTSGPAVGQRWGKWLMRFERLLVISKITESADKRAWLLHFVGERVNDIFDTISENGANNDYVTTVRKLNEYFKPQYEVFKFHKCKQMADETIDAYCTRLRELAASCKFHDTDREIKPR